MINLDQIHGHSSAPAAAQPAQKFGVNAKVVNFTSNSLGEDGGRRYFCRGFPMFPRHKRLAISNVDMWFVIKQSYLQRQTLMI